MVGSGSLDEGGDRALDLVTGAALSTTLAAILGILVVTNEYRHGTVMTTFLAEPRRTRVLGAKLGASVLVSLAFGLGALAVAAGVALPWLAVRGHGLPLDGQAVEAAGRLLLAFALWGAVGAALGGIVHNQVGAMVTLFVWFLVVESIVTVLSGLAFAEIGEPDPVTPYLPGSALEAITGSEPGWMLRAGWAALLAGAYAAVFAALAALSMTRRDP